MVTIRNISGGVSFAVRVHPRARKNAMTGMVGEAIKLAVTAPPIEGRANAAVIEFFADFFEIPRSSITIASGAASRTKVLRIGGMSKEAVEQRFLKILNFKS